MGHKRPILARMLAAIFIVAHLTVGVSWMRATTSDPTAEVSFLDGLRQRRLFSLAESYCRRRLAEAKLTDRVRIRLITELSRCYAERALHGGGADREKDWTRAATVIDDWSQQYEHDSRYLVARVQQGLVRLARGELFRQETELQSADAQRWEESRTALRQAIAQLETIQADVARNLRKPQNDSERLSEQELASLQANIQFQLARAYRNRALTYEAESADRISDLTLSLQQLGPLAQLSPDRDVGWASRLAEITCCRLLGDLRQASELATSLIAASDDNQRRLRVQAEQIRVALAADDLPLALQIIESIEEATRPADLDHAVLEALVAAWQGAVGDQAQAATWQNRIAISLEALGRNHGAFWRNRGGALVAGVALEGTHSNHLDLMVQTAHSLYVNRQWEQAVQTYLRAAEQARELDNSERAFRLEVTAARIEHDRGELDAAILLWRELSLRYPAQPEAAQVHWQAIGGAARLSAMQDSNAARQYEKLLHEHLEHWAQADTSNKARWWLGQLRENQGDLVGALEMYRGIPADAASAGEALRALGRCWTQWLDESQSNGDDVGDEALAAVRHFERMVMGTEERLPERWSSVALAAALEAVRLRMRFFPQTTQRSGEMLQVALRGSHQANPGWRAQAQGLLVNLFARADRFDEALAMLGEISAGSPADWNALLGELVQLMNSTDSADQQQQLASLLRSAATRLLESSDELTAAQRLQARRIQAESMARSGDRTQALKHLAPLAAENPRDGQTQEAYARLLVESPDPAAVESSLNRWREIARRSRPKSERWYRAKYYLALAHVRLGNHDRAAKVLRWVQTIPPGFAGTSRQEDFEKLLRVAIESDG